MNGAIDERCLLFSYALLEVARCLLRGEGKGDAKSRGVAVWK
jgi:hypothetical protein